MSKKIRFIALTLIAMLMLAATAGASSPSITAANLTQTTAPQVVDPTTRRGTTTTIADLEVPLAGFAVSIVPDTDDVLKLLEEIQTFMEEEQLPVIEFYGDEMKQEIVDKEILAEDFDLTTLELYEFVTALASGYDEVLGDMEVGFAFATQFVEEQKAVAIASVFDAQGNVEHIPLETRVEMDEDGIVRVKIIFTAEFLLKVGTNPFALGILAEPLPQ